MIRLPKLFKRKTQANDLDLGSLRGRRTANKPAPRSFQRAAEAEELALTEDPEQQRARHRLIGAAVLVLIAVVGLPRILDNKPKAVTNDIAVNIVTSLPTPSAISKPSENPKADTPPEPSSKQGVSESKAEPKSEAKAEVKTEAKIESKPVNPAPPKSSALGLASGEEVVGTPGTSTAVPAANGSGKFVIQIGAFASESAPKDGLLSLKSKKFQIMF
jgi:DedD protein